MGDVVDLEHEREDYIMTTDEYPVERAHICKWLSDRGINPDHVLTDGFVWEVPNHRLLWNGRLCLTPEDLDSLTEAFKNDLLSKENS